MSGYAVSQASLPNTTIVVVRVENHVVFSIENATVWVEQSLMPEAARQRLSVVQQPVNVATSIEPGKAAENALSITVLDASPLDLPVTLGWKTSRDGEYPFYLTKHVTLNPSVPEMRVSFHVDEASCTRRLENTGPTLGGPPPQIISLRVGTVSLEGSGPAVKVPAASLVYVLVMDSIWSSISDKVWRYADDLSGMYSTVVWTYSGNSRGLVKDWLVSEYSQHPNLVGCLFVGDVPEAWYEIPAHPGWAAESFPIDLYYMDLNGVWGDADGDGVYDSHTGNTGPEIWIGRLKASNIGNEVQLISNYFDKDHAYRMGELSVQHRALSYVDDDWKDVYDRSAVSVAYPDTTLVNDGATTTAADYKNRLPQGYEWVHLMCHGWAGGHTFKIGSEWTGGTVYSTEYLSSDWPVLFFNLFVCSGARYTESGYLAGSAIFSTYHGLLAVGSTKTGSMTNFFEFYRPLSSGNTVGDSLKQWWSAWMSQDWFVDWAYGLTIIGDPTLIVNIQRVTTTVTLTQTSTLYSYASMTTTVTSYTSTTTSTSTIPTVTTVVLLPLTVTSTVQSTRYLTSTLTTTVTSYTSTQTSTSTILTTVALVPLTMTSTVQSTQLLTSILTTTVTSYTGTEASTSTIVVPTTVVLVPSTVTSTVQSTQYLTSILTTTVTSYTSTSTSTSTIPTLTTVVLVPSTVTSTVQSTQFLTSTRTTTVTSYTATTTSTSTSVVYTTVTTSPGGAGAGASSPLAYLGFLSLLAVTVGRSVTTGKGRRVPRVRTLMGRRCLRS